MDVSLVKSIPRIECIESIDYLSEKLAISSSRGSINIYILSDLDLWTLSNSINNILIQTVLKWHNSLIISCSIEGEVSIISNTKNSSLLNIIFSRKFHTDLIKDMAIKNNIIYTCGIDNYINIIQITKDLELPYLSFITKIQAHKSWVTGISVCDDYLISQGSDNIISIWKILEIKKYAEIRYFSDTEKLSVMSKPSCSNEWAILAGTQSQITGDFCVTAINLRTVQIIEIPLDIKASCEKTLELKRLRLEEAQIEVQCSIFLANGAIVIADNWIIFFSIPEFNILYEGQLDNDCEVTVRIK